MKDLFYYQITPTGRVNYHLFPQLDLNLIERSDLMRPADRKDYIRKIIDDEN